MVYLLLFYEFFKIGLFAIGGGLVTLPFLTSIAQRYDWLSIDIIPDMIAISESTPGPIGINMATYAGYNAAGVLGGIVATLSEILPALIIVMIVARFLTKFNENKYVKSVFGGLRPAVVGMIAAAALLLTFPPGDNPDDRNFIDAWSWALFGGVFVGSWRKVNPILLIVLSAAAGIAIYL